ncbi:MAG: hypothetical protein FJ390_05350, partial [Verrucomicrobia bacterium]|nr:hypothetical protein [Verrucomicrobiota bacterium]
MKKLSLFLLVVLLVCIGNLHAQMRLTSRGSQPPCSGYQGIQQEQRWQPVSDESTSGENLTTSSLMLGIGESPGAEGRSYSDRNPISRERGDLTPSKADDSERQERGDQLNAVDETVLNGTISDAKDGLAQNSAALGVAIGSTADQKTTALLDWQKIIKQRHEDFLLQAAFSLPHAQAQAQENADFFGQQVRDLQKTLGTEEPTWIASEEKSRQDQVRAFREKLQKIEPLLKQRELLYQQLSDAYVEKIANGSEVEGVKNILSRFEEERIEGNDKRLIVGEHDLISFKEPGARSAVGEDAGSQEGSNIDGGSVAVSGDENGDSLERREHADKAVAEGRTLVETGIMQIYGIDALERFREIFHADTEYLRPLIAGEVQEFIHAENERAKKLHPDSQRNYFFSSIDSLDKLQRLSPTEWDRLIRSNAHQLHFNPYSGEAPSLQHITDPDQTNLEGIIAVRASLRNQDFFKKATATNQRDILKRFDATFLKQEKRSFLYRLLIGEKKTIPLTIQACIHFINEERARSQQSREELYYRLFSKPHEINQELWSWFAGGVSGERAQPPFTETDHFYRSLAIAVGSAYGMNLINDATRPLRKEAKIQDDESLFESMRREVVIKNPSEGLFQDFSQKEKEVAEQKSQEIRRIASVRAMSVARGMPSALVVTPTRAAGAESAKIQQQHNEILGKFGTARKELALKMLQRFDSGFINQFAATKNELVQGMIESINEKSKSFPSVQKTINQSFQFLQENSSQVIADERERLELIHQKLATLAQADLSQNRLCSASDVKAMQELFEETKETFLLQKARFHESVNDIDQLRQAALKNAELFSEKEKSFQRKRDGGERTAAKMDKAATRSGKGIRTDLAPLLELQTMAEETRRAYEQLASIYTLRIELPSGEENNPEDHSSLIDQLNRLQLKDDEQHKIIVSRNGTFILKDPNEVKGPSHTALKQNGIALLLLAVRDAWGQEGVQDFKNKIQFKRAAKDGLTLGELRQILASKFPESRPPSYFLAPGHHVSELLKTADSENQRLIRSNGRVFSYNPFSTRESSQKDFLKGEKTIEEGVEQAFLSIAQLEFVKNASLLNQHEILKRFSDRFRRENAEPLTLGAFKDFIEQENWAKRNWNDYRYLKNAFYYQFWDPWTLSQEWAGFMGFVTGIRFQPVFSSMTLAHKFTITWGIDVLGEYFGQYREYRDGGTYQKLIDAALDGKDISPSRSVEIPDFVKMLGEIQKEKETKHGEYNVAVQKVLEAQKKYVTELLENRIATLLEEDPKKALLSTALEELRESDADHFSEKITKGMKLLAEDTKASIDQAVGTLDGLQQAVASLANGDLDQNVLFSSKDLEVLQQTLTEQLAELRLEQVRAQQDPERLLELHALVVKNANLLLEKAHELEAQLDGAYAEIQDQEQTQKIIMTQLSIINKLRKEFNKAAQAYEQLADAYAIKVIDQRNTETPEGEGQERRNFLSQVASMNGTTANIVLDNNGHLSFAFLYCLPHSKDRQLNEESRRLSAAALKLLK